ncbi:MAG: chromosomal replication initiator protein DnaA [Oscillospiraceae bacterium]|nr:chromosomal replication initiator protein DnaA [Oscillospiraceae bacterium]
MNSLQEIWEAVLSLMAQDINPTALNTWFGDAHPVEFENGRLVLHTPSDFKKNIIVERYADILRKALRELFAGDIQIMVLAGDEIATYREMKPDDPLRVVVGDYTFENFVVGSSNRFAHAAAQAVSKNPGSVYNPLLIYGNSGLGKTHLLLAIGQYVHQTSPNKHITYIKGDAFTNEMVQALGNGAMDQFRDKYRNSDLLLMDDIQFIAGKKQTQEEFFHTFNALYESGKQIVLTSDRPPMEMKILEDRLRTRLEGGLMADVEPPDLETRMAIVKNKATILGLVMPDSVAEYISENITTDVRKLEGVVKKLTAYKEILEAEINVDSARRAIADVTRSGPFVPTPEIIIEEVARYYGLSTDAIRGQSRAKDLSSPRQISMYLCRNLTNLPLQDIGREFSGRNHATVISSIRKVEDMMRAGTEMNNIIRDITANITSRA